MKINVKMQENGSSFKANFRDSSQPFCVNMNDAQRRTIIDEDYNNLQNKPSINSVTLEGNLTSEDLGIAASFPDGGSIGDILTKTTNASDGVSWVTPASDFDGDNTRPMTAAGVYVQIGNINALLASI